MREALMGILSGMNFSIALAENGFKAIEMVQGGWFDAILMDIQLPGIDGIETLKRIKYIKPSAKVILMTASASEDIVLEARKEGAADIICKPLDLDQLEKVLETICDTTGRRYYFT